jgi:cytochrome c556
LQRTFVSVLLTVLALGISFSAFSDPEESIKYRKNVMKALGGHTGGVFAIAGGKVDYKAHLNGHVIGIATIAPMVKDLFPEESANGDTAAKPEIWSQPDDFSAAVTKLEEAASNLQNVVDSGNMDAMGDALKALGGACKNCHDNYRVKKE